MNQDEFDQHIAVIRSHADQYFMFASHDERTEQFYRGTFEDIRREVHALKPALDPITWQEVNDFWLSYAESPEGEFDLDERRKRPMPLERVLGTHLLELIGVVVCRAK